MSKAFVKDDAPPEEVVAIKRELVPPDQNYMTVQGYEKLKARLTEYKESQPEYVELRNILDTSRVIETKKQPSEQVMFGSTVTVQNEDEELKVYQLVGAYETDVALGKISWTSPIAKALLGGKVGRAVILRLPSGEQELEIIKIESL